MIFNLILTASLMLIILKEVHLVALTWIQALSPLLALGGVLILFFAVYGMAIYFLKEE